MSYESPYSKRVQDPHLQKNVFGRREDEDEKYRRYTKLAVSDTYYMHCIKTCFTDYASSLAPAEKVCLAKSVDRAYDYFALSGAHINPYRRTDH